MITIACLALVVVSPQSLDWPQYRGPDRTGSVAVRDWSPTGSAEPLWTKNVGAGYSSPSIADGRLVTIGFDAKTGVDRVRCLDAKTGVERWDYEFTANDKPMYHGGGTLTTPTIRAGLVYCLNRLGKFHVFELTSGKPVWSRDYRKELELEKTFHGFSASPLLEGDRIFLQFGGVVVAVDAKDGKVIWRTEDRGDLSYANLARLDVGGKPAIAAILGMTFVVLLLEDGKLVHEYPWRMRGNAVHCATPIAIGDHRVFLSSAYGKGCAMLQLGTEKVPEEVWANRRMRNKVTACVQHEGHLYGFDESMLRCLDLDGNSKWRVRGLGLGSLSIAGGRLLVLNSDGELIIAEATPNEFRELSRRKVLDEGVYWTAPVLAGGLIYVRNSLGDMRCFDHRLNRAIPGAGVEVTEEPAPAPADLFARHAELVAGEAFDRKGKALRLRGTWSIPLRGLDSGKMIWTLVAPDRWDIRTESGSLLYTYDGQRAWAIEPQGPRMVEGDELFETRRLFPLQGLFAPSCPNGAVTAPKAVRFAETSCWKVSSALKKELVGALPRAKDNTRAYYFDTGTGRLIGSQGTGLSTLVFHGSQRLGGLILPKQITRFRAEDGQQHMIALAAAEWVEAPADLFALPAPIRRLLRTPAELTRASAQLRKRFAAVLRVRFRAKDKSTPLRDDIAELRVSKGDLWFTIAEDSYRVRVEDESDGVFPIDGPPLQFSIETGKAGRVTALKIVIPELGTGKTLRLLRLRD